MVSRATRTRMDCGASNQHICRMTFTPEEPDKAASLQNVARRKTDLGKRNRNIALLLLGVCALFLTGAFGVGFLVLYGPL